MNNPLRYTDPSGHRCVEAGFEGSCSSVEDKTTKKWHDELKEKKDKAHEKKRSEQNCWGCDERVFTGTLALLEGTVFAGYSLIAYGAVIAETGPIGLVLGAPFLFTALVGADWAAFGAQEILYSGSDREADPLILVHLVFPDFGR